MKIGPIHLQAIKIYLCQLDIIGTVSSEECIHQPLPENPLASMVNLPIVGNLPITAKGFAIVAKGFPGRGWWISQ